MPSSPHEMYTLILEAVGSEASNTGKTLSERQREGPASVPFLRNTVCLDSSASVAGCGHMFLCSSLFCVMEKNRIKVLAAPP